MTQAAMDDANPQKPDDETVINSEDAFANAAAAAEAAIAGDEAQSDEQEAGFEDPKDLEIAGLKEQLLRAIAETENVRRRAERDRDETRKYAMTGFAKDMVSVLENLSRATASITDEAREENESLKNLGDGVDMTMRELLTAFERHGIKRINPMGEKFDHHFHQAMSQIEDAEAEPNTILHVMQAGYKIQDRLLQPAMVVVSKAPAGTAPEKTVDTSA